VILTFEATRRILGLALPIVCGLFLLYGMFGQYLPGDLAHRGYGFDQIVNQLALGTEGIFGIPTLVSATYIFLFHPVRLLPRTRRHDQPVQLAGAGPVGHTKGGAGQGLGDFLGTDGHHLRLGRGQRADHRPVHHSADEEVRLLRRLCRCGRSDPRWAARSCRR
jgi:hypothetical protein